MRTTWTCPHCGHINCITVVEGADNMQVIALQYCDTDERGCGECVPLTIKRSVEYSVEPFPVTPFPNAK